MKYSCFLAGFLLPGFVFAQTAADAFEPYAQKVPGTAIVFHMVPIPAGDFSLGSADNEKGHQADEGPARALHIPAFWMAALETSRDAFDAFANDLSVSQNVTTDAVTRPSPQYIDFSLGMGKEGGFPVQSLSQYAALMYCRWLYEKTGIFYRLPTEAEWEYACRAGSKTAYFFGDEKSLGDYAWYSGNSNGRFHKSGEKKPNAWGLYDMTGNVAEWTLDAYKPDGYAGLATAEKNLITSFSPGRYPKSVRGGSFRDEAPVLRSAARVKSAPDWNRRDPQVPKSRWWLTEAGHVGFRVVRPHPQPPAAEIEAFFKQYLAQ
ncbi:MAG: SUMF1/EgtB/PvdO family nonheme iron enzyme [Flavihumibacter sp.]